jgi:bacillithiol system protein YtxJ
MTTLTELHSADDLERALTESEHHPVLLFKHSLTCPISSRAFREFQSYLENANPGVGYDLITIQTSRPVSDQVASRLGIEHQSPQAILVKNGKPVWSASHFEITESALDEAVRGALS